MRNQTFNPAAFFLRNFILPLLGSMFLLFWGCRSPLEPNITEGSLYDYGQLGMQIKSTPDGQVHLTGVFTWRENYQNYQSHGFVWSDSPNPTVDLPTKIDLGSIELEECTAQIFEHTTTTPPVGKDYYFRAYAATSVGVVYSDELNWNVSDTLSAHFRFRKPTLLPINSDYLSTGDGDKVYIYGEDFEIANFWLFDSATDTWETLADFPGGAREGATSFALNGKIYLGTGAKGGNLKNDFWVFDPTQNQWDSLGIFPGGAQIYAKGFNTASAGYMGFGFSNGVYQKDLWKYDGVSWTLETESLWIIPQYEDGSDRFISYYVSNVNIHFSVDNGASTAEKWVFDCNSSSWKYVGRGFRYFDFIMGKWQIDSGIFDKGEILFSLYPGYDEIKSNLITSMPLMCKSKPSQSFYTSNSAFILLNPGYYYDDSRLFGVSCPSSKMLLLEYKP